MNRKSIGALSAIAVLVALIAFAGWRWRASDVAKHGSADTPKGTPVSVFVRVRDQATGHAIPNMLELVRQLGDGLALEAFLLPSAIDSHDDALARCAVDGGAEKGLRFIVCRQSVGQGNDDWSACAEQSELDRRALEACATGPESTALASRATSEASRRGVTTTPAFFVDGKRVEGDGSRSSLKRAICDATQPKPTLCTETASASTGFPIFVLTDTRCTECRAQFWFRRMQMLFPTADISIVDVGTPAGRAQYDALSPGLLPAVALDKRVESDPGFSRLERELVKKNDIYLLSPNTVRPAFDPAKK